MDWQSYIGYIIAIISLGYSLTKDKSKNIGESAVLKNSVENTEKAVQVLTSKIDDLVKKTDPMMAEHTVRLTEIERRLACLEIKEV